jgi:hypothetical protein
MVNLLHLISQPAAENVIAESARALSNAGSLMVYGPFLRNGIATSEGDASFHASLRSQDPAIGYKEIGWLTAAMTHAGLRVNQHEMPANNLFVIGHAST